MRWIGFFILAALAGCAYNDPPRLPVSVAEYDAMAEAGTRYPRQTIVLINRQRMMDADHAAADRLASLALVIRLADDDPAVRQDVRTLLGLPDTPAELRTAALERVLAQHPPVAKTFAAFEAQGYAFAPRDLHLLERLAGDQARRPLTREQLVSVIRSHFAGREHVHITSPAPDGPAPTTNPASPADKSLDGFDEQLDRLTHADLWNMLLFQEMLDRPDVQRGLAVAVREDRADTTTAWGGLIFYAGGHADMVRYKMPAEQGRSDFRHAFNGKAIEAGRDALARFQFHFEHADNAPRAGPTASDLADAATHDAYGLILTTVRRDTACCAHYYNPQGVIVSLGVYPIGERK